MTLKKQYGNYIEVWRKVEIPGAVVELVKEANHALEQLELEWDQISNFKIVVQEIEFPLYWTVGYKFDAPVEWGVKD